MARIQNVFMAHAFGFLFLLGTFSIAASQEQSIRPQGQTTSPGVQTAETVDRAAASTDRNSVTEEFDGDDLSLVLGGQIDPRGSNSPWLVYLADDKLVMENRNEANSLHYSDITWIKYPSSDLIETTEGAVISVVVEANATATGGVGILIGSGKRGSYFMFSVDGEGRYHLLRKDGRQLRRVHSAPHQGILVGQPNELTFEARGANIAFLVNGEDVIQIEASSQMPGARRIDGMSGIGIAAFGLGTFFFESLRISKGS